MTKIVRTDRFAATLAALLLFAPIIAWAGSAPLEPTAPERIIWQKTPIQLPLTVGAERRVDFPGPVKVGAPASLQAIVRVQSVAGTVYLLAHQPFGPTRVMVRAVPSGDVYLLDLSASEEEGHTQPVQILAPETGIPDPLAAKPERSIPVPTYGYVALTRFAAQQLYAPARLLRDLPGVVRIPVGRNRVALLRGGQVTAEPLVAWRAGDRYVTAVKLTNRSNQAITLDPRALRGTWLTAAFQHNRLLPRGNEADTTAAYLVSARPFETSL